MRTNSEIIDLIKEICVEEDISLSELARRTDMAKSAISRYFNKTRQFPLNRVNDFAKALNTTPEYLLDVTPKQILSSESSSSHKIKAFKIPVLGDVAAGIPIEAVEDIIDFEEIDEELASKGEFFGLRIKGNSMSPRIQSGDVVIVRVQSDAESGDIVIAKVNGDDACCKKLQKHDEGISLISLNPEYEPMFFSKKDIADLPVHIIGKVVELRGKF